MKYGNSSSILRNSTLLLALGFYFKELTTYKTLASLMQLLDLLKI